MIKRAFTILETTGAVALILTLATISLLSVKDTITAGQRSAALSEIQNLNTAWNNYKNAGGTLNSNGVEDVIGALKTPLSITGGTDYTAYNGDPERQVTVGSETFALAYDPNAGFSYISGVGDALSFDGGLGASGDGDGYPFDITDPVALAQAVEDFNALAFDDPARQAYLDAFNAARSLGTVPAADLTAMDAALADSGAVKVGSEWVDPPFDYRDPADLADGIAALESLRGTPEYIASLAALGQGVSANQGWHRS